MRSNWIDTLKKVDDVLEVLVFDWALHPTRRRKTLAITALASAMAAYNLAPRQAAPDLSAEEAFARGTALLSKKAKAPESVALLERAREGMAGEAKLWQNLGHAYLNADRKADAVQAYTKALGIEDGSSQLFFLGYAYVKSDLPVVARGYYDQILQRNRFFYPAMAYKGVTFDKQAVALREAGQEKKAKRHFAKALRQYRRALSYNSNYLPAYFHMGITYVNTKEYAKSIEAFEKVIELDPTEAAAYYNIACCYSLMGDVEAANLWLGRSVEKGFHDFRHMDGDHDLDAIRDSAGYKALRAQAKLAWEAEAASE